MITYIRYKDKIYGGLTLSSNAPIRFIDGETGKDRILNKDEYKQADTIEELCDEFVVKETRDNSITQINHSLNECEIQKGFYEDIYGAIWTDKGLIYVAKMNDRGELELI